MQVKKRNGNLEPLNIDKIHKVVAWATENLSGVSASEVELKSKIQFHDKITTVTIHETLIAAAAELISEECPNYQYVAGRLINYHIRKIVYGQYEPISVYELVKKNVDLGVYDKDLLADYSEEEWAKIDSFVDHNRDMSLTYAGMEQLRGKYLVQNRVTKQLYETPQMLYILIAATIFARYPAKTRLSYVKDYYEAISKHEISLPTPVMSGVRTPDRQFSSCVLIEVDDSLDSINAATAAVVKYVSQKAGIGLGVGRIRALKSPIRNGSTSHTGVTPFFKLFQASVASCCLTPEMIVEINQEETIKIKIKDLRVGDLIKSFDPITKSVTFKEVTDVWNTIVPKEQQVRLEFTNGCVVNCSENHPIMVLHNGNVIEKKPKNLSDYDAIISDDNKIVYLYDIQVGASNDEKYIDITVNETNTFFTQEDSNSAMILTHNSQGGVRSGASSCYFPIWHLEIEDMLVLKNNKGTEFNRVRQMDYGVQFNKFFYERLISGGDITLFSPHDVPEMYEAFFNEPLKFKALYEAAEKNASIRKKKVKAVELFSSFVQERKDTGRIYLSNVDNMNTHSSFIESVAPVRQSNLCAEIALFVNPMGRTKMVTETALKNNLSTFLESKFSNGERISKILSETSDGYEFEVEHDDSRIATCTLSAINWGNIKQPSDFERPCRLAVRALDELLSYQDYPVRAAKLATMEHRPLGIGIINLAYWLAKNDLKYQDGSALSKVDEYAEAWSYYLIKASVDLAKEKGACLNNHETKYSLGIMPIDTRKTDVDQLVPYVERMPWAELREEAKKYGVRNATLMACMPAESSATVGNATNGIEPPRALVSIKQSKDGVLKQVVPGYPKLKNKYDLLWDQKSPIGYLNICAVLQKYIDQAISVNTSYNPRFYPDEKIPMSELLQHILHFYKFGGKNLYYNQTMDGQGEIDIEKMSNSISKEKSEEIDEENCESCKL